MSYRPEKIIEDITRDLAAIKFGKVLADADQNIPNRCVECGNYRLDGKPPALHARGCSYDRGIEWMPDVV